MIRQRRCWKKDLTAWLSATFCVSISMKVVEFNQWRNTFRTLISPRKTGQLGCIRATKSALNICYCHHTDFAIKGHRNATINFFCTVRNLSCPWTHCWGLNTNSKLSIVGVQRYHIQKFRLPNHQRKNGLPQWRKKIIISFLVFIELPILHQKTTCPTYLKTLKSDQWI